MTDQFINSAAENQYNKAVAWRTALVKIVIISAATGVVCLCLWLMGFMSSYNNFPMAATIIAGVIAIAAGLSLLITGIMLISYLSKGAKTKCPHCDRWWGRRVVQSEFAGSGVTTEQRTVTDDIRAVSGPGTTRKVGEINRKVNVQVSVGYVQMGCQCAWCGGTWSAVGTI